MKKSFLKLALAVLTVGLLGSCSKINERLDNLDKRVDAIENEKIASINTQITSINSSIADLGQIRSDISSLKQSAEIHSQEIFDLQEADRTLKDRIVNLENYLDGVLPTFAEKDWVIATFSTLEQYEETCDTIAKIDARIGALDAKLSKDIKATADSLTKWVNKQFEGYYTAAQMDAKLAQMKSDIDSARAAGKISDAKADSIATELTNAKAAVDTAKAAIRVEYKAAIKSAIETSEGKLTKAINDAIATVNGKITALTGSVSTLEAKVTALTGRVDRLEAMIQSVTIVPAYSDGSVEAINGILELNLIVSPSSAAKGLTKEKVKILLNTVATKAAGVDTVKVDKIKSFTVDQTKGTVEIKADISDNLPSDAGQTLTVAVNVKNGDLSDITTEFVTVDNTPGYTVKFNENYGESPATRDTSVIKGGKINKPADPTREGWFFDKWFTKNQAQEVEWNFTAMTVSQDTTLYAGWIQGKKVTFRKDTVDLTVYKDTLVRKDTKVNKPADPDSTGYAFRGWYTRKDDGTFDKEWDFGTNVTADTILFAKWAKVKTVAELVATNSKFPVSNSDDEIPENVWLNANNDSCYFVTGAHIRFMNKTRGGSTAVTYPWDHPLTRQDDGSYQNDAGTLKFVMDCDSVVSVTLKHSTTTYNGEYAPKSNLPDGALAGVFSISGTSKVRFSKGNLVAIIKASGSPTAWKFATNQYDYIGNDTANNSIGSKKGDVDIFAWSTPSTTYGLNPSGSGYTDGSKFKDWGIAYCESNSIAEGTWRTLSKNEWTYLFNTRTASTVSGTENARYAKATVNSKAGVILLPDTYTHPEGVTALTSINTKAAAFTDNTYDSANWAKIESAGAVFLPAAGQRTSFGGVTFVGSEGYYWSSSSVDNGRANYVSFKSDDVFPGSSDFRKRGRSVRLVTDVK